MTTTNRVLRITFATSTGETMSFTLPDPKFSVTQTEIEQVMDLVISKNIFDSKKGSLVSKKDIKIIDTSTEDLYEPQVI